MNLEQQVTSLALSKRLKELGVKQMALFWWSEHTIPATLWNEHDLGENDPYAGVSDESVAAFTVAELGELLPNYFKHQEYGYINLVMMKLDDGRAEVMYKARLDCVLVERSDTEAEARGLVLAHLIENKLLSA